MKLRSYSRISLSLASAFAALLATRSLTAVTYYWDINGTTTTAAAGTGTWSAGSTSNWSTAAAGNIATSAVTTTNADDLIFSATGMNAATITVDTTQSARSITFGNVTNQVYTISGGTGINLGNTGGGSGVFNLTFANQPINTPIILDPAAKSLVFGNFTTNTLTLSAIAGSATSGTQALIAATTSGNLTLNGAISNGAGGGNVSLAVSNVPGASVILTNTNTYTGSTRVVGGTLRVNNQVSLYNNGTAATWSKDNIIVGNGATLAFNVGGAGQFTKDNINTILGLSDAATNGFMPGSSVGIDTTGGNLLYDSVIANTNSGNNALGLTKLGTNNLTLDQTNTYTGSTLISAGTLIVQGSIATSSTIVNNAALIFNSDSAQSYGNVISGSGALTKQGTGTLTLSASNTFSGATLVSDGILNVTNAFALRNSALNTSGLGTVTLTGVTTPSFGGLTGSFNLLEVVSAGYDDVTAITLNPLSGSLTYGGIIENGTSSVSLIKSGLGTQVLQGENTYNGSTTIRGGNTTSGSNPVLNTASGTLALSGGLGSLLNTSGIALEDDGILRLVNISSQTTVDRVNSNAITVTRGGSILWENTSGNDITYAETLGAITHSSGQLNIGLLNNQTGTGTSAQTLTLGGLTPSGTASVTFSAAGTGPQISGNKNMIVVTSAGSTSGGNIVGPWATTGTTSNIQTDYAVYNSDYVTAAGITANNDETTWTTAGNVNINAAVTLTDTRTLNTLRDSSAAANTLALGTNHLETRGILTGSTATGTFTISGTGSVRTPSGGGNLYLTTGAQTMTISAPITNDSAGTGVTTLVKSGNGGSGANNNFSTQGTLVINSTCTYTGDTFINAGTLRIGTNNTVNGAKLGGTSGNYAGNIFIGAGAMLYVSTDANQTLSGNISGEGTLMKTYSGTLTLSGNNTYTGRTSISPATTSGAGVVSVSSFNSVFSGSMVVAGPGTVATPVASSSLGAPKTVFNGTIDIGGPAAIQGPATLRYTGLGETTDRVINFHFGSTTSRTIENNGPGLLKFTSPVTFSNFGQAGPTTITLGGSGNGELVWGLPSPVSHIFTKTGNGTWTLGGPVGTGGAITVSAGSLILNGDKLGTGTVAVNGTSTLGGSGTIAGTVTVAAGAKLAPGNTVGSQTFTGLLNISAMAGGAGTINMDMGPIAASDKIIAASVNIGSNVLGFADFVFNPIGGLQNGPYTLIESTALTGTLDTNPANLTGPIGSGTGTLQINGNNVELVVTGIGGDTTPPTLVSITDNVSGGPVNIGATVTYTVTFDEDMDAASVTAADFANNGTAVASIGTVTETITPGVFTVPVTVTSPGTLVLRINALAVLEDVAGNDLDTDPALLDDTTITVRNAYQTWALTNAISSAPNADKDGDGVNNAIEFVLGGTVGGNDLDKLPTVSTTATDMIFSFKRARSSIDGVTGLTIELGTTLSAWPTFFTVGTTTGNSTPGVVVTPNTPTGFDTITLTVPQDSDPKKFARLKATVTE